MRIIWKSLTACLLLLVLPGSAMALAPDTSLYRAQAVVTGQGEVNRRLGLAQCLEDVLVKVSGDPRLIGDTAAIALGANTPGLVTGFSYHDRLAGKPVHDEQGTNDRPHDLLVDFDPKALNIALQTLGRTAWLGPKPRIAVFLAVQGRKDAFVLASDSEHDPDMRASLTSAADRVGLPMSLPAQAQLMQWDAKSLATADLASLDAAAKTGIGDLALSGSMVWSDEAPGWIADWRLGAKGRTFHWQIRGVSFDDAFRNGLRGALQISFRQWSAALAALRLWRHCSEHHLMLYLRLKRTKDACYTRSR
ncbi:DUF2066 domain-containing protein [Phyllobacterium sp. 628]|uniref:DUF2066 domain-containing protein n=1 Tax=Phyllobacterium sp. 628 TaxID=2718938 RepID=UPI00166267D0|nr:DUF2066 domain-containing protein [Phyllobacterium sp. 628]QND51728.1 DUF2066 domain-containing protein [Phyllobacterium sp. 628]